MLKCKQQKRGRRISQRLKCLPAACEREDLLCVHQIDNLCVTMGSRRENKGTMIPCEATAGLRAIDDHGQRGEDVEGHNGQDLLYREQMA